MSKLRIMMVNEASFLHTGYANYGHAILKRLFDTKKYEIAELAGYGHPSDERASIIPWRYYW